MFTGLVQEVGILERVTPRGAEAELRVACTLAPYEDGESIAIDGACLSVTNNDATGFSAFASSETLARTGLANASGGRRVNLERALSLGASLGGHLVTGHVDARVAVLGRDPVGDAERFTLALPGDDDIARQIASKGSVTLDGVSLTVNNVGTDRFDVMVIPLTLKTTTLGDRRPGDQLNLETDVLAKYVARHLGRADTAPGAVSLDLLAKSGFVR